VFRSLQEEGEKGFSYMYENVLFLKKKKNHLQIDDDIPTTNSILMSAIPKQMNILS